MQNNSQAVNIGARGGLRFAILLWRGVSRGTEGNGVFRLSRLEVTRDAKIDQVDLARGGAHDVGRFEIAKDYRWLLRVEIIQDGTELNPDIEDFAQERTFVGRFALVFLECFAHDKVHDQVPVSRALEMFIQA